MLSHTDGYEKFHRDPEIDALFICVLIINIFPIVFRLRHKQVANYGRVCLLASMVRNSMPLSNDVSPCSGSKLSGALLSQNSLVQFVSVVNCFINCTFVLNIGVG